MDLRSALPHLLPKAIAWAEARASEITSSGFPLDDVGLSLAHKVGVQRPDLIRVSMASRLPLPSDPQLQQAAVATGLLGPGMVGLTLGSGIYICNGHRTPRLLSHECRHVYQYEQAGSIAAYLPIYLKQIVDFGYNNAPFEIDARRHEFSA
jgi:hypothetical protein